MNVLHITSYNCILLETVLFHLSQKRHLLYSIYRHCVYCIQIYILHGVPLNSLEANIFIIFRRKQTKNSNLQKLPTKGSIRSAKLLERNHNMFPEM